MDCLVLCGGYGTRARRYSLNIPKNCILVNKKPFIYYQIKNLKKSGIKKFYFLSSYKSYILKNILLKLLTKTEYEIIDDGIKPMGTAIAVENGIKKFNIDKKFFITYGDSYLKINKREMLEAFNSQKNFLFIYKNFNKFDRSNIEINENLVCDYKKSANYKYIDYGMMCFDKHKVLNILNKKKNEGLGSILKSLIEKKDLYFIEIKKRFYEIGSYKGYKSIIFELSKKLNNE